MVSSPHIARLAIKLPLASSLASGAVSPGLGWCHFLDIEDVRLDCDWTLLHKSLGCLLSPKGDKSKVLWFIVVAPVHWPGHLHRTLGDEVSLNLLVGDSLSWKVAQVDLALLCLGLAASHLTVHNLMFLVLQCFLKWLSEKLVKSDDGRSLMRWFLAKYLHFVS